MLRFVKTANFADLWDELLAEGRSSFTASDLQLRTGVSLDSVYSAVKYAMDRRRLFSPVRGLYVVVPAEHRAAGVVQAFVDDVHRVPEVAGDVRLEPQVRQADRDVGHGGRAVALRADSARRNCGEPHTGGPGRALLSLSPRR